MARRERPERTCVGCRERAPREALLRIARLPDGPISVDRAGTAPGRGAYVHRDLACVARAVRLGALLRALRTSLRPEEAARLKADIEREVGH